jgi:hypothetical protein
MAIYKCKYRQCSVDISIQDIFLFLVYSYHVIGISDFFGGALSVSKPNLLYLYFCFLLREPLCIKLPNSQRPKVSFCSTQLKQNTCSQMENEKLFTVLIENEKRFLCTVSTVRFLEKRCFVDQRTARPERSPGGTNLLILAL